MKILKQNFEYVIFIALVLLACQDEENFVDEKVDLSSLTENEFVVVRSENQVSMIVHDCGYNQLRSVNRDENVLEVVKTFNSMMKRPCILRYDTISLGILEPGEYRLDYFLIDLNTLATDSIFHFETKYFSIK
jgi:hypothetical protein